MGICGRGLLVRCCSVLVLAAACGFASASAGVPAAVPSPAAAQPARATTVSLRDFRVQVQARSDAQAGLNFDAVFFGIELFAAPIRITEDSPLVAQNPRGLVAFIASLIPVFQQFSDPAALEPFLSADVVPAYRSMAADSVRMSGIVGIYNGLESFELYCGWFVAPQTFIAVLKIVRAEGDPIYSPVQFSFADGEWKLVFGEDAEPVVRAAMICAALDNPRRIAMRYRNVGPEERTVLPAAGWRAFF